MNETSPTVITLTTLVDAPVAKVWQYWTQDQHITNWNNASEDWYTPAAKNDLRIDGRFVFTMAARDGSMSFDFEGVYTDVVEHKLISYVMADGRKARITFQENNGQTEVVESFEAENVNSIELQKTGWQNILDNFKKYTESH